MRQSKDDDNISTEALGSFLKNIIQSALLTNNNCQSLEMRFNSMATMHSINEQLQKLMYKPPFFLGSVTATLSFPCISIDKIDIQNILNYYGDKHKDIMPSNRWRTSIRKESEDEVVRIKVEPRELYKLHPSFAPEIQATMTQEQITQQARQITKLEQELETIKEIVGMLITKLAPRQHAPSHLQAEHVRYRNLTDSALKNMRREEEVAMTLAELLESSTAAHILSEMPEVQVSESLKIPSLQVNASEVQRSFITNIKRGRDVDQDNAQEGNKSSSIRKKN